MSSKPPVSRALPKSVYAAAIAAALIGWIVAIVSNASESNLVALSYLLVPLLVFGIVGLVAGRNLSLALIWAGAALAGYFVFIVMIFPKL